MPELFQEQFVNTSRNVSYSTMKIKARIVEVKIFLSILPTLILLAYANIVKTINKDYSIFTTPLYIHQFYKKNLISNYKIVQSYSFSQKLHVNHRETIIHLKL